MACRTLFSGEDAPMAAWIVLTLLMVCLGVPASPVPAYVISEIRNGGAVAGRVVFAGPIPELPLLAITKDQDVCGLTAEPQMLIVSPEHRGVPDTVIALEGIPQGKAPSASQPGLDNRSCTMLPRVQAVMLGTELLIRNSDPFLHTTRGRLADAKQAFNVVFPKGTSPKEQKIRFPGVITVTCDTHTHMRAYILSFDHPYFAVTAEDGRFQIDQVPPGAYTLKAWHEGWRIVAYDQDRRPLYEEPYVMSTAVKVTAGETSEVDFQLTTRE
jgi:carboxypeptidase family protein